MNYLVLAKTDLEDYFKIKLLEKTGKLTVRSRTDLEQIDGAQWRLISYKVQKGIVFGHWSYC